MKKKIVLGLFLLISLSNLKCSASHTGHVPKNNNSSSQSKLIDTSNESQPMLLPLRSHAKPSVNQTELLQWAARENDIVCFDAYLKRDVDINAQDKDDDGNTPLHWAVSHNNSTMVKKLISAGADRAIKDKKHGDTPLHTSIRLCNVEMVKLLLSMNGPSKDEQLTVLNKEENVPLDLAQKNKDEDGIHSQIFYLVKTRGRANHPAGTDKATVTGKRKRPSTQGTFDSSPLIYPLTRIENDFSKRQTSSINGDIEFGDQLRPSFYLSDTYSKPSDGLTQFRLVAQDEPTTEGHTKIIERLLIAGAEKSKLVQPITSRSSSISPSCFSSQQLPRYGSSQVSFAPLTPTYQSSSSFDDDAIPQRALRDKINITDDVAEDRGLTLYGSFDETLSERAHTSNGSSTSSSSSSSKRSPSRVLDSQSPPFQSIASSSHSNDDVVDAYLVPLERSSPFKGFYKTPESFTSGTSSSSSENNCATYVDSFNTNNSVSSLRGGVYLPPSQIPVFSPSGNIESNTPIRNQQFPVNSSGNVYEDIIEYFKSRPKEGGRCKNGETTLSKVNKTILASTDSNKVNRELLKLGVKIGSTSFFHFLLITLKADIHFLNTNGATLLHMAAASGYTDIAKLLIDANARLELEHRNRGGETPLMVATRLSKKSFSKMLIDKGAKEMSSDDWVIVEKIKDNKKENREGMKACSRKSSKQRNVSEKGGHFKVAQEDNDTFLDIYVENSSKKSIIELEKSGSDKAAEVIVDMLLKASATPPLQKKESLDPIKLSNVMRQRERDEVLKIVKEMNNDQRVV